MKRKMQVKTFSTFRVVPAFSVGDQPSHGKTRFFLWGCDPSRRWAYRRLRLYHSRVLAKGEG